jgi:hypothetical protein
VGKGTDRNRVPVHDCTVRLRPHRHGVAEHAVRVVDKPCAKQAVLRPLPIGDGRTQRAAMRAGPTHRRPISSQQSPNRGENDVRLGPTNRGAQRGDLRRDTAPLPPAYRVAYDTRHHRRRIKIQVNEPTIIRSESGRIVDSPPEAASGGDGSRRRSLDALPNPLGSSKFHPNLSDHGIHEPSGQPAIPNGLCPHANGVKVGGKRWVGAMGGEGIRDNEGQVKIAALGPRRDNGHGGLALCVQHGGSHTDVRLPILHS